MEPYGRLADTAAAGGDGGRLDPDTGLEESLWRMGLGGGDFQLPERPGEPDCAYYLRTGTCGYGDRCRYNHPRDRGAVLDGAGRVATTEYPERVGQPVCEYYMKTGTCRFGLSCKYHHPRLRGGSVLPAILNYYGYPLRPGEKECSYYLKTGRCKFGSTCKFDHPEFGGVPVPSPTPSFYQAVQPSSVPSSQQYPPLASWQLARPSLLPGSYVSGSYGPMVLSPGVIPVQGWSPYPASVNPVMPSGGQQTVQTGQVYGISHQGSPSMPAYTGSYVPLSSSAGPSSSNQREEMFPERPGQPECQYYMRTGDCKFRGTCKYHHPRDWNVPISNCVLSPLGLPLRPGAQTCTFYAQNGFCKFGPTCKFNHPMGSISYSPSASSLSDMPVAPYPIGFSVATLAPSSSSSDLRPEFFLSREPFMAQATSSESMSGLVSPILFRGGFAPHSLIHPQTSPASGSSSTS